MPVEMPEDELARLAEMLDGGKLHVLRDRYGRPRRVRQGLTRFSDRVWMFPFGVRPDEGQPVQVFVNGVGQYMGEEVEIVRVGERSRATVAVTYRVLRDGDVVQATYVAVPETNP